MGVVEVLGHRYKPNATEMPSWTPAVTHTGNSGVISEDSRRVLENNKNFIEHTVEPTPDSVLILTPVKNNAEHLEQYFSLLDKLEYPRNRTSIAFLVSDSDDTTQEMLVQAQRWYQDEGPKEMRFHRFEIYRQDFFYSLARSQRHSRKKQLQRRTVMARARNYLWTRALGNEQWVVWIDGDLEQYPATILRDLMAYDKDIIVPNCMQRTSKDGGIHWKTRVYDRNAWQETDKSRAAIAKLDKDAFLLEGYKSLKTYRRYLDNFPKEDTIVPLDGVGGTFTLVKADVHRSGVVFPTWIFEHQVETEGFAKLAKANGFGVYGLPFYYIRHISS
ncbi:Mannan polymerase II complex anp1 subunit [Coemansia sp. RSA 988]|nr:Mannan polymerase II complex anp1 subunit [Coemansia sp. RSA 988]